MAQSFDLHVHTTWSDGKSSAEDVILAAIAAGLDTVGISDHSYTVYDEPGCTLPESASAYRAEIRDLAEKYKDKIRVLCGVEQDYCSGLAVGYDYAIGSVHAVEVGGDYVHTDWEPSAVAGVEKHFGGDWYAFANAYYERVGNVVDVTGAGIVGHFDVITVYNGDGKYFDTREPRYVSAWRTAADRLLSAGAVFEVNTGAISRGYRKTPYPAHEIYDYIRERGGRFILASDAHRAENVAFGFDAYASLSNTPLCGVI